MTAKGKNASPSANDNRVYFDTFVFMDLLSGNPELAGKAESYLKTSQGIVSSILLTELAYHIARRKKSKVSEILFCIQSLPNVKIVPVDKEIASLAGSLRAKYRHKIQKKLTYFDSIHIATALQTGCKKFVTGDRGFREVTDIEIEVY